MKQFTPGRSSNLSLDEKEWRMFDQCPDKQLKLCLLYEYARESKLVQRWIRVIHSDESRWQKAAGETSVSGAAGVYRFGRFYFFTKQGDLLRECREFFPAKPWLAIPEDKRKAFEATYVTAVDRFTGQQLRTKRRHLAPLLLVPDQNFKEPPLLKCYWTVIDWKQHDALILERMDLWLKQNRPPNVKMRETRGQTTPRDLLKALGAWRLSRPPRTPAEALEYSNKVLGEYLYAGEAVWSKSVSKAMNYLKFFNKVF